MGRENFFLCINGPEHITKMIATPIYEPHREKTCLRGFRPSPTQTGLHSQPHKMAEA